MKAILIFVIVLVSAIASAADRPKTPVGTFIQWYLAKDWTDAQWREEFGRLREAGMDTIVFAPVLDGKTRDVYYASSLPNTHFPPGAGDIVEALLRNAKKARFKVFLGLNMHDDWWSLKGTDPEWLTAQMREGNEVADDLYQRYKSRYRDTFVGWYWVWEVDNLRYNSPKARTTLTDALEMNVSYLHKLDKTMPVMLCPFMNYRVGKASAYGEMWKDVFARTSLGKGDIFAPQDCVGAGGLDVTRFEEWMRTLGDAVRTKPGLRYWIDAETFVQEDWSSAPLSRFAKQVEVDGRYAEKIVTFAYSHYYSPCNANPAWQKAYVNWVRTGRLGTIAPPRPETAAATLGPDGSVQIAWVAKPGPAGDSGYEVLVGDRIVGKMQIPKDARSANAALSLKIDKTSSDRTLTYSVRAFDVYGNRSTPVPAAWQP